MSGEKLELKNGDNYNLNYFRLDYNHQITRTEYKPIDPNNQGDPFDGKTGYVYQIDDFNTGAASHDVSY